MYFGCPMRESQTPRKTLAPGVAQVLKRLRYLLDLMLPRVRWCVAYALSLHNLEEMMAERGIAVDHSPVHRWVIEPVPLFEKTFRLCIDLCGLFGLGSVARLWAL
jgi:putative transposase